MIWLLGLGLIGCGDNAADTGGLCDRDPPLDYDNFGAGWMREHCAGCHSSHLTGGARFGAPLGVDLDTWEGVLTWAPRVEARAGGDAPDMPPGGGPTEQDRALLAEWFACEVNPSHAIWSGSAE